MRRQQGMPGAIMLGSDFKALGVVRSLGRRGIPSVVIDNQPRSAWFSRYVVKRFRWKGSMDESAFLIFLLSIGKEYRLERWVLFPLQDEVVEFVARHNEQLSKIYQLVTQDWDIVQWACDKHLTYQMAHDVGVPYPKTWYPTCEDDLQTMEIAFPAIIKPTISIHFQQATRLKALPVGNHEELLNQYRLVADIISPTEIMIQEVIPGNGSSQYSFAAYCKEGNAVISITARRTRQYPIDYGLGSSFVEAVEVPAICEPAKKLLAAMRVTGMVEVEFKHDHRDGQYKLLDVNLRPWGWHTLCIACGLDFPYIQYRDALGDAPTSITPRYGYHWVRLLTDIPAGIQEMRAGITTLRAYLRSLAGNIVFSVFDWRDPLPAVGDFVIALSRSLRSFHGKGTRL
ncbi:MAG TPA: ATP-grasp domain-containing protein [Ktedonobacteraceae bacterium]|nr:ATP-grasp domain-containing protein [Ktedonobacteraceae bacterium]